MSVNVSGDNSLNWTASIGTETFDDDVSVIIKGHDKITASAESSSKAQEDAFQKAKKGLQDLGVDTTKLEQTFRGFVQAKTAVVDLQTELAKLKAPEYLTGKTAAEIEVTNRYIKQQEKLLVDLQAVVERYADQLLAINEIELTAPKVTQEPATIAPPEVKVVSNIVGAGVMKELKEQFNDIDPITRKFIQDIIDLELRLNYLKATQNELAKEFAAGNITQAEYAETSAFLVAGITDVAKQTEKLTANQKIYDDIQKGNNGSIIAKKEELQKLRQAYEELSESERKGASGAGLSEKIGTLAQDIDGLDPVKIEKVTNSFAAASRELAILKGKMLENQDSPLFDEWQQKAKELKEGMLQVKESVEQATNDTAGVEAFASGLRGLLGGFEAGVGVIGLFTDDTAEYEKVTKNAASALALMNGIQEISNVLSKTSALNIYLLGLMRKTNTAAIAAETVATEVNIVVGTEAAVVAEAQAVATTEAAVATRGLTAAMLANPAAVILGAVAALVAVYLAYKSVTGDVKDTTELLAEANKKVSNSYAEKMAKLLPLVEAVKQGNLTDEQSLDIHKQLSEIDADLIKGLDAKKLSYQALTANVELYAESLRKQYRIEANKEAVTNSIKNEEAINAKLKFRQKQIEDLYAGALKSGIATKAQADEAVAGDNIVEEYNKKLEAQRKVTRELVGDTVELSRTNIEKGIRSVDAIDKEIAEQKKLQTQFSDNSKIYQDYGKKINALELERKKIVGESKSEIKAAISAENKAAKEYNKLLEEQKNMLEVINNLKRDAYQSGLTKELTELDKINEKYDAALKKIQEFNARAPKNLRLSTAPVNEARATELQNQVYKNDAADYKKSIDDKRGYFEEFENFKLQFGTEKANELFKVQTNGSASYLEYLKQQKAEIEGAVNIGPAPELNNGQILKVQALTKAIAEQEAKIREETFKKQIDDYKKLLEAAISFNEQRAAINTKYAELESSAIGDKSATAEQTELRLQILKDAREAELKGVNDVALQSSDIYKKLNQDILDFTNDRLQKEIEAAKKTLEVGTTTDAQGNTLKIPPEVLQQVKEYIDKLEDALKKQKTLFGLTSEELKAVQNTIREISGMFSDLSNAIRPFNEDLADTLESVGDLANVAGDAVGAFASFASGDIVGGIKATIKVVTGLFSMGARSRESERKARAEVDAFNQRVLAAEINTNQLYRERARQQVLINKLKIEGLQQEFALLEKQKKANLDDYTRILGLLANESFIASEGTKKTGGILGFGRKTKVTQELASLAGKDFEDLEKLYNSGQLTEKAKALFEQLQAIKAEGIDIDAALEANKLAAQEIFTGTTSDSILDSIVQGFADGKRATADFADDFQSLMQKAVLNALKYQALEKPLKKFYEDFAAAAESDGILTESEIAQLQQYYNDTINAAGAQFQQLKDITNLSFGNDNLNSGNSLQGAIKGITQQQADLLAGQFGGLRLTAFDQLTEARNANNFLRNIDNNTRIIADVYNTLAYLKQNGIKML